MHEAGFQIRKKIYPLPVRYKPSDCVLVEQLTNLTWMEYVERLPDLTDDQQVSEDPIVQLGMIGVSVARANPEWSRDRVVKFMNSVFMDEIEIVGPEDDEDERADPLALTNGSTTSEKSAETSKSDSGSLQDPSTPKTSGIPA